MPRKKQEVSSANLPLAAQAQQPVETDESLMMRYFQIKDWLESETKRFKTHVAPHAHEMEVIEQEFLKRLNDRGSDSTKSDSGTAYKSTLLNVSVSPEGTMPYIRPENPIQTYEGREALLEFSLDYWDRYGSDMLMISAQKDAVKRYMEDHNGQPPPGVKTAFFTRVNIRRS